MATVHRLASNYQLGTMTGQSGAQLTLENVSSIPRRSNTLFLSDYLQEQRAHKKHYAEEGRRDMASWVNLPLSGSPLSKPSKLLPAIDDFLLGTPILKARTAAVEKPPLVERRAKSGYPQVEYSASSEDKAGAPNELANQRQLKFLNNPPTLEVEVNADLLRKDKPKKCRKRKMEGNIYSDDDHVKRLEERREKKRAKRNIMERLVQSDSENDTRQALKKWGKKLEASQPDIALMHGFTATNVGKTRITLQSLRNIGVFKKGKASCALKIGNNIKKSRTIEDDICFSESRFLNVKSCMKKSEISSLSGSCQQGSNHSQKLTDKVGLAHGGNDLPYDPANSVIWDIEKESAEESEVNEHQGTVVVKFPRNLILSEKGKENYMAPDVQALADCADITGNSAAAGDTRLVEISEVSLRPSQSASLVQEKQGTAPDATKSRPTVSKYFGTRYDSPPDNGQVLKDIRSTTPIAFRKPPIYLARLSPNSSPRIETRLPDLLTFSDPRRMIGSLPDVSDDISVADSPRMFVEVPYFSHDTVPTHFDSDIQIRSNTVNDLALNAVQCDYQDAHDNGSGAFCDRAGFPDWAQINEWCFNPHEPEVGDETPLLARQVNGDVDTPIEEYRDRFSDGVPSMNDNGATYLNGLDLPDSFLIAETPDTYDSHDTHSSLGSVCHVDNFSQGRFLLYCVNPAAQRVTSAEAEVARLLKQSHWVPHRF